MSKNIIAIGGLGGSGTRAVANIFIQAGIYMGDELNRANDNLLFTRLLRNPDWYRNSSLDEKKQRLRLFVKYMNGSRLKLNEFYKFIIADRTHPVYKPTSSFYQNAYNAFTKKTNTLEVWGWKEPNTQIYAAEILSLFPNLKYMHVLRHGLDMAFSRNKNQLKNWGWKYGIHLTGTENESELAAKQLEYWIESTKNVLKNIRGFEERTLILNYTDFCTKPKNEIDKILDFCKIIPSKKTREALYLIPQITNSKNRYKDFDLSIFRKEQLEFVRKMGFII